MTAPIYGTKDVPLQVRALLAVTLALLGALGGEGARAHVLYVLTMPGLPDPDWPDGPLVARKTTLKDVLDATGTKTLQ